MNQKPAFCKAVETGINGTKIVLAFLFLVLFIAELIDLRWDVNDLLTPFLFLLSINGFYQENTDNTKFLGFNLRASVAPTKGIRALMSFIFLVMLGFSLVYEHLNITPLVSIRLVQLWAFAFLLICSCNLKKSFSLQQVLMTKIALLFFVGSFVIF